MDWREMGGHMYKFNNFNDAYDESKKYCEKGKVASFPPYITFELTKSCNFRCPICHVAYSSIQKKELPIRLFRNIIDEIARYGSMVRLIGYCEPLLYTGIKDAISYVREKGLLLHITTNGSMLDADIAKTLIGFKADCITFSFQGLSEEEYCFMRGTTSDVYAKVLNNIKSLYSARGSAQKPFIKITTTITERDDMVDRDKFMKTHLQYADEVQISGYTSLMHLDTIFGDKEVWSRLKVDRPREAGKTSCYIGNYEMLVKADGDVCICCGAYGDGLKVGNVSEGSLNHIWQSGSADKIRELLCSGELEKIEDCSACPIRYEYKEIRSTVMNSRRGMVETSETKMRKDVRS